MVDTLGLIHEIHSSEANKYDKPEGLKLLEVLQKSVLRVEKLLLEKGYDSKEFIERVKNLFGWTVEKSEKLAERAKKGFVVEPF
ncbi:MAG: hypothetical protein SFU25_11950 [Candidatus Caenarcaniphilales bacterium]|nr:hypothetical protein [Candidatus Caenarcaniphilales bacterium]